LRWFNNEPADWQHYVKQCYFDDESGENKANQVVRWRCAYYDYWKSVCYNKTVGDLWLNVKTPK